MRQLPTTGNSPDRQRKVADAVNALIRFVDIAEADFADDTAAAAGGVEIGGLYHNAGAVRVRLT